MMRQSQSALRLLRQLQADRRITEADNTSCNRAAWAERCTAGLMLQALQLATPPPEPPPPEAPPPRLASATAAEEYAILYPERAALIRRLGRVPDNASFGPPAASLVRALVASAGPADPPWPNPAVQRRDPASHPPCNETRARPPGLTPICG